MANRIKTSVYVNVNQILFCTDPQVSVGILVSDAGITAGDDGKKIVKAGTPMIGSLEARETPFTKGSEGVVGVLLHDVDVTAGAENGTLLIFGFVDLNKVDAKTVALLTESVKTALKGNVTFLK